MTTLPALIEKRPTCRTCGGTGRIICMNSWFPSDGYRKERCGICGGTGISSYKPDRRYERCQEKMRAALKARAAG